MRIRIKRNYMKKLVLPLLLFAIATTSFGQTISADDILKDIKRGKDINYSNVTIEGTLDLTYYFEKKYEEDYSRKKSWFGSNENSVEEIIEVAINFTNCTFEDDVLAYYHDDGSDYTFIANFENDVVFKNCKFNNKTAFKYSEFEGASDFSESYFNDEALFKYAEFEKFADFGGAVFDDDANFKYAEFNKGLNFSYTSFDRDLNLKYAKIRGDFSSRKMSVRHDLDVKYTEINGESFSKYLLNED